MFSLYHPLLHTTICISKITVEYRQRLLNFGLQFRSDFQQKATLTRLTPSPARFGFDFLSTLFIITFQTFIKFNYNISDRISFVKRTYIPEFHNLFSKFSLFFVHFVFLQRTSVLALCLRWISCNYFCHCNFLFINYLKFFCTFPPKPIDFFSFLLYIVDTNKKEVIPMKK